MPRVEDHTGARRPLSEQTPHFVSEAGWYRPFDFWLSLCGLYDFYAFSMDLLGDLRGRRVLDCGCGPGHTSIMMAKRGAFVTAFDTAEDELTTARSLAEANEVEIEFLNQRFESLELADEQFDLAFGSCVLHHTDVARAARELRRVLVPGARAVFIENSASNPLLMGARAWLCGKWGIPKYRDEDNEHPLTTRDLDALHDGFAGELSVHWPSLVCLRLADFYVFKARSRIVTRLLRGADEMLGRIPGVRQYGYFQVIELVKPGRTP